MNCACVEKVKVLTKSLEDVMYRISAAQSFYHTTLPYLGTRDSLMIEIRNLSQRKCSDCHATR